MYQKILVPIDGSETSTLGLNEAIELAKSQSAKLKIVHVLEDWASWGVYGEGLYSPEVIDELRSYGESILQKAKVLADKAHIACECQLLEKAGSAASALIINAANEWEADLIVIGTHGRRGVRRIVMGSDAEEVVRHAAMPVLLIRAKPAKDHHSSSDKLKAAS